MKKYFITFRHLAGLNEAQRKVIAFLKQYDKNLVNGEDALEQLKDTLQTYVNEVSCAHPKLKQMKINRSESYFAVERDCIDFASMWFTEVSGEYNLL